VNDSGNDKGGYSQHEKWEKRESDEKETRKFRWV
jgi:hypothetical protein